MPSSSAARASPVSKETKEYVKRDLEICQKRPRHISAISWYMISNSAARASPVSNKTLRRKVKRDLEMCEKRLRTITAISTQILEQRCMCITHVKINHQVCRKRPRNVKRDLDICQKRPRNVKRVCERDLEMSKET